MSDHLESMKQFFIDLREGQSRVTRMLQEMFSDPASRQGSPNLPALKTPGAFDGPLPPWARQALADAGLSEADIDHIDEWPQKEPVRQALVEAIEYGKPINFSWDVDRGDAPTTHVDTDAPEIVVKFVTPFSMIRESDDASGTVDGHWMPPAD
jgi:hypothetical protein